VTDEVSAQFDLRPLPTPQGLSRGWEAGSDAKIVKKSVDLEALQISSVTFHALLEWAVKKTYACEIKRNCLNPHNTSLRIITQGITVCPGDACGRDYAEYTKKKAENHRSGRGLFKGISDTTVGLAAGDSVRFLPLRNLSIAEPRIKVYGQTAARA
jgi:hypothetical protein